MKQFLKTHEWIECTEIQDVFRFGLSKYILQRLGNIAYVELPELQGNIKKGDILVVLESSKTAIELYSPCDCVVFNVNNKLLESTELLNCDSEGEGWLIEIIAKININELMLCK